MLEEGKRKGSAMNIEIAQRLYELRRKHGFSQESLAAELGLSRQAISKWERSESAPDMGNLIALADLYGMTIDELIRPAAAEATDETSSIEREEQDIEETEIEEMLDLVEPSETALSIPPADTVETDNNTDDAKVAAETETGSDNPVVCNTEETEDTVDPYTQAYASTPTSSIPSQSTPYPDEVKQVVAHGHLYTKPIPPATPPRCALRRFPYPLAVIVFFLIFSLVFSYWGFFWLFITIPFYYWVARIIERDPKFLASHGYISDATDGSPTDVASQADAKEAE